MNGAHEGESGLFPTEEPPTEAEVQAGTSRPDELSDDELALAEGAGERGDPSEGLGAWQSNKRVIALWGVDEPRNAWIGVAGLGWRKLAVTSDSGVVAMSMLGALARQTGRPVRFREDERGTVYELYVW